MSPSICYWYLMSGGKYFEFILIYFVLDIGVSKKKCFRSQDINLPPLRASEIVLLNKSFESIRDDAGDDTSLGYSSLSSPTVSLTLYGFDFSGC